MIRIFICKPVKGPYYGKTRGWQITWNAYHTIEKTAMPVKLRHTHPHAPHAHKIVSILSGFKAPHINTLAHIFPEFDSWVWFSLKRETIIEGDKWRDREEVVSYAALFSSVVVLREDRHKKWAAWQTREEKEIHNDWVPSPDMTSLHSSWKCLLVGKLIESAHESSTKWPAYHQTNSSWSLQICLPLHQTKWTHYIGMELKKKN